MPYIHFSELSGDSRVWIYQPSRLLTPEESAAIDSEARAFIGQWTSHNRELAAWGGIIENLFLVFMVDETHADASGCSIDKSVAFVRDIEQKFQLDFFDRWQFAYLDKAEKLAVAQRDDFAAAYQTGEINAETIVFNNLVKTKTEWQQAWRVALGQSWHKNFV